MTGSISSSVRTRSPITIASFPIFLKATQETQRKSRGYRHTFFHNLHVSARQGELIDIPGCICPDRPRAVSTGFQAAVESSCAGAKVQLHASKT
jgi:hypothetical protein